MAGEQAYNIAVKSDGKFYLGYCLEIPKARGQENTKEAAVENTKRAIKLCRNYLEVKKRNT